MSPDDRTFGSGVAHCPECFRPPCPSCGHHENTIINSGHLCGPPERDRVRYRCEGCSARFTLHYLAGGYRRLFRLRHDPARVRP